MPSAVGTSTNNNFDYSGIGVKTEQNAIQEAASQVKDQTLTQEDFLLLLTTQLQAQDPTNPADNTELVSQMSQLSMVESLNSINTNMHNVIDTVTSSSALNATSLIGAYVYTDDKYGYYDGASSIAWAIDAGEEMYYDLQLTIKDAVTGEIVYTDTADALTGETKFAWPGIYSPEGPVNDGDTGIQDPDDSGEHVEHYADAGNVGDGSDSGTGEGGAVGDGDGTGTGDGSDTGTGDGSGDGDKNPEYEYCTAGRYILEVTGTNSKGESVQLPISALGLVTSVTLGNTMEDTLLSVYCHGNISFDKANKVTI